MPDFMQDAVSYVYEFGEFYLDPRRRSLSKNGENVPISGRNFDLLLFLVESGGRIVEHDELLEKVWAGTFVEQATLTKGVSAIRQVLSETPEDQYIQTIPRRGYCFVSAVRALPAAANDIYPAHRDIDAIDGFPHPVRTTGQGNKRRLWLAGGLAVTALIILTLAFYAVTAYFSRNPQPRFAAENVRITRITNSGRVISGAAVSADGTYLLYSTLEKEGVVLWLRQILANSATKLTSPAQGNFWGFAVAPDNSYVYYIFNNLSEPAKSGLYKVPLLGGEPHRIAENISSFAISPDGKQLAVVRIAEVTTISIVNASGDNAHTVTTFPGDRRLSSIVWTPDGLSLLCTLRKTDGDRSLSYVHEISAENGKETILLPEQERVIYSAKWLPDKSAMLLIVREPNAEIRQIWEYFPSSQEWRRVTNDNNSYRMVSLTRDGKTIISIQENRLATIWLSDAVSSPTQSTAQKFPIMSRNAFRQITDSIGTFYQIAWLPGGQLIYSATDDGREMLFTVGTDGANARGLTSGEDDVRIYPSVTGDGQHICFLSSRSGTRQVWRIDPRGKNPTRMSDSSLPIGIARILRDNSTVIYVALRSGVSVLLKQGPDGQITELNGAETGFFAISPDEKLMAIETMDMTTRKYRIELRSMDNGQVLRSFDFQPVEHLIFTPDGKNLAYDTVTGEVSQVMIQPLAGGEPYALTDFQTDRIFSFDWSPDGNRLAIIRGKELNDAVMIKAETR